MKNLRVILLSLVLTGCSSFDFTKLPDDPLAPLTAARTKSRQLETGLIREYQHGDRTLNYLSKTAYSCDDPKKNQKYKTSSIQKIIEKEDNEINKKTEIGMEILNNYAILIKNIKEQSSYTEVSIKNLEKSLKLFGVIVGTRSSIISEAIGQLAQVSRQAYWQQQLFAAALSLEQINEQNFDVLEQNLSAHLKLKKDVAFRLWDACAREKLLFLRDAPLNKNRAVTSVAARASITDLADAYKKYLENREAYLEDIDIKAIINKIRTDNSNLIKALKTNDFNKLNENSNNVVEGIHIINTKS